MRDFGRNLKQDVVLDLAGLAICVLARHCELTGGELITLASGKRVSKKCDSQSRFRNCDRRARGKRRKAAGGRWFTQRDYLKRAQDDRDADAGTSFSGMQCVARNGLDEPSFGQDEDGAQGFL